MKKLFLFFLFYLVQFDLSAQTYQIASTDTLPKTVLLLEKRVFEIENNLYQSKKQLKTGIFVATLGYSVTIVGGQLLGSNPKLGETLLYVGGGIGISGTVILVKGFKKISVRPPGPPI
ncbi:hypothetical protein [Cecembia calidifontis]|jgi:hypothetical protein|uniref:Uncharacterized protein n=1 Tax=Cecembia calidifontis TaxID=1187080 RepID=A0A4Q7PBF8_9BACT|nr:hypothetical protein [Cecembia calidifontis]RZS97028.1 hypothetical protein BC751_2625 [Cecembia calidifontis]